MLIEHLAGELESLTVEIETGQAPFDQQQKLMMEFFEKRINSLEEQIEKIKDTQLEIKQKNGHLDGNRNGLHYTIIICKWRS